MCIHVYIYIYIYIYSSAFKKKHSCPTTQLQKTLTDNTTILEHQNNKQKLQILEATGTIYRITFKSKRYNLQGQRRPYTVVNF